MDLIRDGEQVLQQDPAGNWVNLQDKKTGRKFTRTRTAQGIVETDTPASSNSSGPNLMTKTSQAVGFASMLISFVNSIKNLFRR
jgi:hypothetical protein